MVHCSHLGYPRNLSFRVQVYLESEMDAAQDRILDQSILDDRSTSFDMLPTPCSPVTE